MKKKLPAPKELMPLSPEKIKGLTINEIRYRRALLTLQKDFCREKMMLSIHKIANSSPFSKGYKSDGRTSMGRYGAIMGKLVGGLNYVDAVMVGFSVFQTTKKIFSFFKRKK